MKRRDRNLIPEALVQDGDAKAAGAVPILDPIETSAEDVAPEALLTQVGLEDAAAATAAEDSDPDDDLTPASLLPEARGDERWVTREDEADRGLEPRC